MITCTNKTGYTVVEVPHPQPEAKCYVASVPENNLPPTLVKATVIKPSGSHTREEMKAQKEGQQQRVGMREENAASWTAMNLSRN